MPLLFTAVSHPLTVLFSSDTPSPLGEKRGKIVLSEMKQKEHNQPKAHTLMFRLILEIQSFFHAVR